MACIVIVILRRAQLVPGWVTVFGWVNHLSMEPGTQVDSARAIPPLGKKQRVLRNSRPCNQDCWHTGL